MGCFVALGELGARQNDSGGFAFRKAMVAVCNLLTLSEMTWQRRKMQAVSHLRRMTRRGTFIA
jgi:hypothetical protein